MNEIFLINIKTWLIENLIEVIIKNKIDLNFLNEKINNNKK